ncbi:MAG TPA: hypothetical protein PK867_07990 [Pirellulales bacterium]|nr:hypothetical protein [Pirellulales bacterium]
MNRLRFDCAARMPKADWRFETERLRRLLHQYAERRGFAERFDELSHHSRPDVVRVDRERRPRKVFVGNAWTADLAGHAAGVTTDEIRCHMRDFRKCVSWGVGGLFAIATNSLGAGLDWVAVLDAMAQREGLTGADVPSFRIKRIGRNAWLVTSQQFESAS